MKILTSMLVFSFILWVLPLGYFIKPSQEKAACNGERAICMCHAVIFKSVAKSMETGMSLKAGQAANKENSSGPGNSFISAKSILNLNSPSGFVFERQIFCYSNPFLNVIESVPKV